MRRRAKAELGTFSASAIDLFASALGAFIIITVVLFPYFPNLSPDPLKAIIEQLREDKQGLEDQIANLNDQNNSLQSQLDGTAFIGIEPVNIDFQLVLDMSGSIEDYTGTVQKIVGDILSRMDNSDNLRIITYQGDVSSPIIKSWPGGSRFRNGVTDSDKSSAQIFVNSALTKAGGFTPTFKAMDNALAIGKPTTIILVTDGVPQVLSGASRKDIESAVQTATSDNAGRHQINIVAIGEFVTNERASAIVPLATQNGGVLVAMQ